MDRLRQHLDAVGGEHVGELAGAPIGSFETHRDDPSFDLGRRLTRRTARPATAVGERVEPALFPSLEPTIAGLTGDLGLLAQLPETALGYSRRTIALDRHHEL